MEYKCQSLPPEDHGVGLSTFTIMAGLGGSSGYAMGAIDWDQNFVGESNKYKSFIDNTFYRSLQLAKS